MNKIYKIVFNRLTNTSIVTSELAKGRGKTRNHLGKGFLLTALGLSVAGMANSAIIVGKTTDGNRNIETGWVTAEHGIAIGTGENDAKGRAVVRSNKGVAIGHQAGTDGVSGLALGDHAATSNTNTIAIGTNAKSKYDNGIAIGANSRTNDDTIAGGNDYSTDGIAIGNGAKTKIFGKSARRANVVKFGRTKVAEGIAIGSQATATTGSIHIGNQDYNGAIGEYDLSGTNRLQAVNNVGATTLGDNSINRSHFSAVIGAYNSLSSIQQSPGRFASLFDGSKEASNAQGMGATILGTLNSMENLPSGDDILKYSGISNSIVGTANKIKHSNGALIWGTGNEINRSLLNMNNYLNVETERGDKSIRDFQNDLMNYSRTNRAASVGVIGSDNQVNQTLFSTVFGVGNKVLSNTDITESDLSASNNTSNAGEALSDDFRSKKMNSFLSVSGYENQVKDVTRGMIMGVKNITEYATDTLMFGNYHALKGTQDNLAERNILLGFNYDNVNPEHHADQPTKEQADVAISVKDTIGIGSDVKLGADRTIAMGKGANAKGEDSISIGTENLAGGIQTIAVGYKNIVKATHSGAFGDPNFIGTETSNTTGTYAFGNNNGLADRPIITNHTFILGSNVVTTADNSVALGKDTAITAGSADTTGSLKAKVTDGADGTTTTAGATGTVNTANVNGVEYSGFAGGTAIGAVSVGASGLERRIQNVAAGEISGTSTDGINGSQLYAVADTLSKKMLTEDQVNTSINNALANSGWKIHEDNGTKIEKDTVKPNDNVVFAKGTGTTVSVETTNEGKETTIKYNVNVDDSTIKVNDQGKLYAVVPKPTPIEKSDIAISDKGVVTASESEGLVTAKNLSAQLSNIGLTLKSEKAEGGANTTDAKLADGEMMKTGSTITMSAGKNISVEHTEGGKIVYKTQDDVNFNSVQLGNEGPKVTSQNGAVSLSDKEGKNPVKLTGVADGAINATSNEAINGSQLYALEDKLSKKMITEDTVNGSIDNAVNKISDTFNTAVTNINNAINNSGWKISEDNGTKTEKDTIKSTDNVVFAKGNGTTVSVETTNDGKETTVKYNVDVDNSTIKVNDQGKLYAVMSDGSTLKKTDIEVKENGTVTSSNDTGLVTAKNLSEQLSNVGFTLKTGKSDGSNTTKDKLANGEVVKTGNALTMSAGKNMEVEQKEGGEVIYKTKDDVNFNSVQLGKDGPKVTSTENGAVSFSDKEGKAPVKVTGVADGAINANSREAINGSQLYALAGQVNQIGSTINKFGDRLNQFDNKLSHIDNKVNKMDKKMRAGIAGANAAVGIPQVYLPGKSMVAASAGTFKGQHAFAVGYSRASDNGKMVLKLQGNINTSNDVGGSVGVGYQW